MRTPFVGIDGCRGGWIGVGMDTDAPLWFRVAPKLVDLVDEAGIAAVDIPIGLPERGSRGCDQAARDRLGRARNRVFPGARRPFLRFPAYAQYGEANSWAEAAGEKKISRQMHAILPKIAEADAAARIIGQDRLRETHPELVFMRLNGGTPLPTKHGADGLSKRRAILLREGFILIDAWAAKLRGSGAKADDLYDACACALAARDGTRLDGPEERDSTGLRMEMWY